MPKKKKSKKKNGAFDRKKIKTAPKTKKKKMALGGLAV